MPKQTNPHMYYWVKDDNNREWRLLLVGEYERFEDGTAIVSELEVAEYWLCEGSGMAIGENAAPIEIRAFGESLLEDKDTYTEIKKAFEEAGQHLL